MSSEKRTIATDQAPAAIGPYAQAIDTGVFIFTSGQLPLDPRTGTMPDSIAEQTRQCLANIQAVLEASGSSMDKVVKMTVFLKDLNDFDAMNEVYATFFSAGQFPSRSAVEVARLPRDARLEIEAVALKSM